MRSTKRKADERYKPNVDEWIERKVGFRQSGPNAVEALVDQTLGVHSESLPVDPFSLAEGLGCRIRLEDIPAGRLEATSRGKIIRIPKTAPSAVQRFSVAHEIGHLLFTEDDGETLRPAYKDEALYSDSDLKRFRAQSRLEHLCNVAARILLLPRVHLQSRLGSRSDMPIDCLLEFSNELNVRPSVFFDRLVDIDFFQQGSLLILLEFRPNRFTGRDTKWRIASRFLPYKYPFNSLFWENQSIDRLGIDLPLPNQPPTTPSSLFFKVEQKNWTMYPNVSEANSHWILCRLETTSAERNLLLFPA